MNRGWGGIDRRWSAAGGAAVFNLRLPPKASGEDTGAGPAPGFMRLTPDSRAPAKVDPAARAGVVVVGGGVVVVVVVVVVVAVAVAVAVSVAVAVAVAVEVVNVVNICGQYVGLFWRPSWK